MKYITADHAFGGNGTFYLWIGTIGKSLTLKFIYKILCYFRRQVYGEGAGN